LKIPSKKIPEFLTIEGGESISGRETKVKRVFSYDEENNKFMFLKEVNL
jgi:hypothetical protein